MQLKRLALQISLILAAFTLPPLWLVTTNSGLNTALRVASWFAPYKVSYESASGNVLTKPITVRGITITENEQTMDIAELKLDWRVGTFDLTKIQGLEHFLPAQQLLAIGKQTSIATVSGTFKKMNDAWQVHSELEGTWQAALLNATVDLCYNNSVWQLHNVNLNLGSNSVLLSTAANQDIAWNIQINNPGLIFKDGYGAINAFGTLHNITSNPTLNAAVKAADFGLKNIEVKNLSGKLQITYESDAPVDLAVSAEQILVDNHHLSRMNLLTTGKLSKHTISLNAKYNKKSVVLKANAALVASLWQTDNLQIHYDNNTLSGPANFDIASKQGELNLRGKPFDILTECNVKILELNKYQATLGLYANKQNYLHASLNLNGTAIGGSVKVIAEDLSYVMKLLPDVTRLKGNFNADATISGTIIDPKIVAAAHLTNITATLPGLGIKIKPMELHLHNEGHEKLVLTGNGKMRRGTGDFKISGSIEPFKPNMPNVFKITGKDLEFINNATAHLTANNDLQLSYDVVNQRLDLKGHIDILRGNIYFNTKQTSTVKSKDVVFVDSHAMKQQKAFSINPDLNIWIYEEVHFSGFGLEAKISGNLDVTQRHDALYGEGRVTIKEGSFQLPGQKLRINKGRLLYPAGTLLVNPGLDIKMFSRAQLAAQEKSSSSSELEIIVRGTAQAPLIHEANMGKNRDMALSQAMLAGSSVISKNLIQEKLKLTELGVANQDNHQPGFLTDLSSKSNPSFKGSNQDMLANKDLVIGRPLGNKLYLQYLHSINDSKRRGRLKYALNENWSLDLEAGNKGAGADISFSIERD